MSSLYFSPCWLYYLPRVCPLWLTFVGLCWKENDIFLGWDKGTGKKWGKSKKKGGSDLSLEEIKKQAAVQCLRSASDEVSGYWLLFNQTGIFMMFMWSEVV